MRFYIIYLSGGTVVDVSSFDDESTMLEQKERESEVLKDYGCGFCNFYTARFDEVQILTVI